MATNASTADKRTGAYRPSQILLGVDIDGAHHIYQTDTETIHIVHEDGSRGRKRLGQVTVDRYVDALDERGQWETRRFGVSLTDELHAQLGDEL